MNKMYFKIISSKYINIFSLLIIIIIMSIRIVSFYQNKKTIEKRNQINLNKIKTLEQKIVVLSHSINDFLEKKQDEIQRLENEINLTQKNKNKFLTEQSQDSKVSKEKLLNH
ncbi:MAG: hypothetical protein PR2021_0510 [Candidatus Phytoplasma pruni]|nr:MAG: hypothetical protein PR2021_0510 [Candidatus Phytoplasma pruni]